jgi:hypothetical protein
MAEIELSDTAYPPNTSDAERPHEDSGQLDYFITRPGSAQCDCAAVVARSFGATTVRDDPWRFLDRLA